MTKFTLVRVSIGADARTAQLVGTMASLMLDVVPTTRFSVISIIRNASPLLNAARPMTNAALKSQPHQPVSDSEGDASLYNRLIAFFDERHATYESLCHEPTLTSEASVSARQRLGWTETTLKCGAKAMLMRRSKPKSAESHYVLCVLAADRKLDYKKLKKTVGKDLRLATENEVFEASKCLPGAVPPFGSKFFAQPPPNTFVDRSLTLVQFINFNCGLRTRSVKMSLDTYLNLESPTITDFSS